MSKIILGKSGGRNVGFDLDELLITRLLITANSGGGKSYLVRRILEQAFGKIQCFVIDVAGEFATLREKYGYVLVGDHGETPVDIRSAGLVAEKLLELRASAVFDLYSLKPPPLRHTWVKHFLAAMMNAPKKLWHPVLVIVDEAHKFMPENGEGESEAKPEMLSLCSDGRKYGYCAILPTQRLAKLDKSGASELLNVMVGPTFIDVDLQRAHKALGIVRADWPAFDEQMKTVAPGHFWALGRAISKKRILVKVGDVATTHPKPGVAHSAEPPPAPEKVKGLLPKLADLPQAAETKARTEAEFRREIRELKTKLTLAERAKPAPVQVAKSDPTQARSIQLLRAALKDARGVMAKMANMEIKGAVVDRQAVEAAVRDAVDRVLRLSSQASAQQQKQVDHLKREAKPMLDRLQRLLDTPVPVVSAPATQHLEPAAKPLRIAEDRSSEPALAALDGLSPSQTRILNAIAEFEAVGIEHVSRKWLAARANASHSSSHFQNNLGALRSRGLIDYAQGAVRLTSAGRDLVGVKDAALTAEEMAESCKRLLTPSQQKIFEVLHAAYPQSIKRDDLATQAGASSTSSHFQNNLGTLRSAGMIEYEPDKGVRMEKWIFLENGEAA